MDVSGGSVFGVRGLMMSGPKTSTTSGCALGYGFISALIHSLGWINSAPRRDKNKILPHGIPAIIHAKPHAYNSLDFKVYSNHNCSSMLLTFLKIPAPSELFDEVFLAAFLRSFAQNLMHTIHSTSRYIQTKTAARCCSLSQDSGA